MNYTLKLNREEYLSLLDTINDKIESLKNELNTESQEWYKERIKNQLSINAQLKSKLEENVYYIFPGFNVSEFYKGKDYNSPMTNYYLSKNQGEFFGEGNFCGYYGFSGNKNCHVIGKTEIKCDFIENDSEVAANFKLSIIPCDYISGTSHEDTIPDRYTSPYRIVAKNDSGAFTQFVKYVKKETKQ